MPLWCVRAGQLPRPLASAVLFGVLGVVGCGGQQASVPDPAAQPSGPIVAVHPDQAHPAAPAGTSDPNTGPATTPSLPPPPNDEFHLPFAQATRAADNPPVECERPPDETVSQKPTYKLLQAVMQRWSDVRFATPSGKKIDYSATVETSVGSFTISLRPDLAPNHVRNFVTLAEVGYYDGLFVDRIRHEEGTVGGVLQAIELGCPLGTGEPGYGSIGYWLKPEFRPGETVSHDAGTVSACRGIEEDTAACRFSVLLTKAPYLDGHYTIFGKVVDGLDVVRKIHGQPVIVEEQDRDGARRPEKPILINKVVVHRVEH